MAYLSCPSVRAPGGLVGTGKRNTGLAMSGHAACLLVTSAAPLRAAHAFRSYAASALALQVSEAFSSLIARIVAQIPNPPEPSLLLRKRIKIGKQLAENKSFRAALFDLPSA